MNKLIPNTSAALKIYGVDLTDDSKWVRFGTRPLMILASLVTILWSGYRMKKNVKHIPVDLILTLLSVLPLICLITINKSRERIRLVFKKTKNILSLEEMAQIQKYDRQMKFVIWYGPVMLVTFLGLYCTMIDYRESLALFIGYDVDLMNITKTESDLYLILSIANATLVYYIFFSFWTCVIFYITVYRLILAFTKNCRTYIRSAQNISESEEKRNRARILENEIFKELLERFKYYNEIVTEVNQTLGILPFLMFVGIFGSAMGTLCYVTMYGVEFSLIFILVAQGMPQAVALYCLCMANKLPCDAYDTVKRFRTETAHFLTSRGYDPYSVVGSARLGAFLAQETLTPPTVWSMFEIRRALPLIFAEIIMPFSIMVVTLVLQYKTKLQP